MSEIEMQEIMNFEEQNTTAVVPEETIQLPTAIKEPKAEQGAITIWNNAADGETIGGK